MGTGTNIGLPFEIPKELEKECTQEEFELFMKPTNSEIPIDDVTPIRVPLPDED